MRTIFLLAEGESDRNMTTALILNLETHSEQAGLWPTMLLLEIQLNDKPVIIEGPTVYLDFWYETSYRHKG